MSNKVLYFPYINVPSSVWFTRMLLYWDNVASIVPLDYMHNPEQMYPYMRSLVLENLVEPIFPGQFVDERVEFKDAFVELAKDTRHLTIRQKLFERNKTVKIHAEKLGNVAKELKKLNLAEPSKEHGWHTVETNTANEFMCYLAAFLGQHPELEYTPITDQIRPLRTLAKVDPQMTRIELELTKLRTEVLENALPSPKTSLQPYEIRKFKEQHGDNLKSFRRRIEMELTSLADIQDAGLRKRRMKLLKEEIKEEADKISAQMKAYGFNNIVFGTLCPLLSIIPDVIPKIIGSVLKALDTTKPVDKNSPWAYAAFARRLQDEPKLIQPT